MINLKNIFNDHNINFQNTGSSMIQIFLLSLRIKRLQKHLYFFKKDFHSRLGLLKLIFRRRKLLKYIKLNNVNEYNFILKKIKLNI